MENTINLTVSIEAKHFAAVAMFRAKKDIRFYLQGVHFEAGPTGAFLIATCGGAMAVHKITSDPLPDVSLTLPESMVDQLEKTKIGPIMLTLNCTGGNYLGAERREITASNGETTVKALEIDAYYPQWRRVINHTPSEAAALYHPDMVAKVYKAGAKLRSKSALPVYIRPGGAGCGFASLDTAGDTCAWVMPMRDKVDDLPVKPGFEI